MSSWQLQRTTISLKTTNLSSSIEVEHPVAEAGKEYKIFAHPVPGAGVRAYEYRVPGTSVPSNSFTQNPVPGSSGKLLVKDGGLEEDDFEELFTENPVPASSGGLFIDDGGYDEIDEYDDITCLAANAQGFVLNSQSDDDLDCFSDGTDATGELRTKDRCDRPNSSQFTGPGGLRCPILKFGRYCDYPYDQVIVKNTSYYFWGREQAKPSRQLIQFLEWCDLHYHSDSHQDLN